MKIIRSALLILSGATALGLSACGEGWEVVPFRGQVPYTEERTAGSGVAYVRAMLLPEKGPVLPWQDTMPFESSLPMTDAAPLFTGPQLKK